MLGLHYGSVLTAPTSLAGPSRFITPVPPGLSWLPFSAPAEPAVWQVSEQDSPEFRDFVSRVSDGNSHAVRGVFVAGILSLPIVDQPPGEVAYVSDDPDVVTMFSSAANNDVTGLLAHNYLAGALFYQLQVGQEIRIVYGDSTYRLYEVTEVDQYRKLQPTSLRSELIHLEDGRTYTTDEVFNRFYRGPHHVTFQTCLAQDGLSNWGLTFIVATPIFDTP